MSRPHQFPESLKAFDGDVLGWECAACGKWIREGVDRSKCPIDWRKVEA